METTVLCRICLDSVLQKHATALFTDLGTRWGGDHLARTALARGGRGLASHAHQSRRSSGPGRAANSNPPAVTVGGEFYHRQPFEIHCGLLLLTMAHGAVQRVAAGMVVGLVKACAVSLASLAGNSYNVPSRNRSSNIWQHREPH